MLKHRIITALILIPIVIWGIFQLPTIPGFASVLGLFVALGVMEWTRLIHLNDTNHRYSYLVIIVALMLCTLVLMDNSFFFAVFLLVAVIWWTVQLLLLSSFDGTQKINPENRLTDLWSGAVLLVPTWASLVFLHQNEVHGSGLVLFLMVLIWTADSGAYFVGRKFGRVKLAPLISPGKSREGAYGALAASTVVALIGGFWLELGFIQFVLFILLSLVVVVFSIGGDLMESVFKRRAGVKDSGTLLPGHGGVLDRIDSLMSASPIFTLGVWALGII